MPGSGYRSKKRALSRGRKTILQTSLGTEIPDCLMSLLLCPDNAFNPVSWVVCIRQTAGVEFDVSGRNHRHPVSAIVSMGDNHVHLLGT